MRTVKNGLKSALILLVLCTFFIKCNITYKVRNQFNNIERILHVPCGKVTIELVGKGNSKFVLKQKLDLDSEIMFNLDSLYIFYNDIKVKDFSKNKLTRSGERSFLISNNKTLETAFDLDKGVFEGDTIIVFGPGIIVCNQEPIDLDTIYYSFRNNIRIRGVNDF